MSDESYDTEYHSSAVLVNCNLLQSIAIRVSVCLSVCLSTHMSKTTCPNFLLPVQKIQYDTVYLRALKS